MKGKACCPLIVPGVRVVAPRPPSDFNPRWQDSLSGVLKLCAEPLGYRWPAQGHSNAGRAGVAAAPLAQHPPDPRHIVDRPPAREPGRRAVDTVAASPGGVGRHCRRTREALMSEPDNCLAHGAAETLFRQSSFP